jgi:Ser/Thr protein kinase RdoA (MazF antagonist)
MKLSTLWAFDQTIGADGSSPIATQIARRWDHDPGSIRFFRSSANVIYILTVDGERCFLRCAAATERTRETIENELAIIDHVHSTGMPVVRPIGSLAGSFVETVETGIGSVHAVLFQGIPGELKHADSLSESEMRVWGATIGKLHALLATVPSGYNRKPPGWQVILDAATQGNEVIRWEGERLSAVLQALPHDASTYGLLHNDLELDNLIWRDGVPTVLDFDEYSSGWYLTDIAKALDEPFDNGETVNGPGIQAFLAGYRSEHILDEEMLALLPEFSALIRLHSWTLIGRSLDLAADDVDQDWMKSLIGRFANHQRDYEASLADKRLAASSPA